MEWCFEGPEGAVTVRQEGNHALCQAIRGTDREGLYKAWLRGEKGRALLGTLIPEGGALRLRRSLEISQLERQGAWPPVGADIGLAWSFAPEGPPTGWAWTDCPRRLLGDSTLSQSLEGVSRALLSRDTDGFFLAFPYDRRRPFPIPPLFCLAWLERLSDQWYVLFRFSRQGCPELPHIFPPPGENRSGIQHEGGETNAQFDRQGAGRAQRPAGL